MARCPYDARSGRIGRVILNRRKRRNRAVGPGSGEPTCEFGDQVQIADPGQRIGRFRPVSEQVDQATFGPTRQSARTARLPGGDSAQAYPHPIGELALGEP